MTVHAQCIASSLAQAQDIARRLNAAGIQQEAFSTRLPDPRNPDHFDHEFNGNAPGTTVLPRGGTGGMLSGPVGWGVGAGVLGWLVGLYVIFLPDNAARWGEGMQQRILYSVLAAGMLGLVGIGVGMWMARVERRRYAAKLRDGRILITVTVADAESAEQVRSIFTEVGAQPPPVAVVDA